VPRHIRPQGWIEFDADQTDVSNFIRDVQPQGFHAWLPGVPRVHPPEPIIPQGYRADIYGQTFVSNYIRYVDPVGFDALEIGPVGGSFKDRMRVSERHTVTATSAHQGEQFGVATASNRVRSLRPTDEIIGSVSGPRVTARSYVTVAGHGFDAGMFGDVQRWEAGKIKPYGDDALRSGVHRIARGVQPLGFVGVIGLPSVANPIRPSGALTQVIGDAVVSHGDGLEYTCGQLPRALAVPANQFTQFGTATVQ
jgi:hypothetical protein